MAIIAEFLAANFLIYKSKLRCIGLRFIDMPDSDV